MAMAIFMFVVAEDFEKVFSVVFFVVGIYGIVSWLLSPKSIVLEGTTLVVRYFFKEVSYSAGDIQFISLEKRRTKNGYVYFVQINLESGKKIKLPSFRQGNILTYQILKRWHEQTRKVTGEIQGSYQLSG
jgi:hypothetical protein